MPDSDLTAGSPAAPLGGRLSHAEFAGHFQASFRLLWLVAKGIVGEAAAAEDIVQEAGLVALEKLDQFETGTSFTAWMAQMVRYVALNDHRKIRRRHTASLSDAAAANVADQEHAAELPDMRLVARGELPADQTMFDDPVVAALQGVQGVARACLLLRTLEGMEYREIAQMMDIPEGTAMSHVHRARRYLRDRLASYDAGVHVRQEGVA